MKSWCKINEISAEFKETFPEVVKGFAAMKYSRRLTAKTLGINYSYFRQLCTRFKLHQFFHTQRNQIDECRGKNVTGKRGWPKGKKRNKPIVYSDQEILQEIRKYPTMVKFQAYAKMHPSTVVRRFESWQKAKEAAGLRPVI